MDEVIVRNLFSSSEKQTLYQVMCAVRSIGSHHLSEKEKHIHQLMRVLNISSYDQQASRTLTQLQMTSIMKGMEDVKKLYFAKFLSQTALIGGLSEKESLFLNWLFSEINIPSNP
ncbi:MAG: hypothetical protein K2M63_11010 [Muribaculaceae bacterium]|nr:hypothetical protein [Muribaculaceae bacterium]